MSQDHGRMFELMMSVDSWPRNGAGSVVVKLIENPGVETNVLTGHDVDVNAPAGVAGAVCGVPVSAFVYPLDICVRWPMQTTPIFSWARPIAFFSNRKLYVSLWPLEAS